MFVRSRRVVCSGRAGDSPVTHRSCRSREDRQEHVQVVLASNWCLRVGRVRFGSAGVAHHGFPVVCVEAFRRDLMMFPSGTSIKMKKAANGEEL